MPSLSQPFRLTILPKIASLSNFALQSDYIQVNDSTFSPTTNKITIGISGSSVSQYIVNPTPKLIFNFPIPSTNIVTACNVFEQKGSSEETWCFATMANKTSTLNLINKNQCQTNEEESGDSAPSDSSVTSEFKIKADDHVVDIKILNKKKIIVVLKNGKIQTYDFELKLLNSINMAYNNVRFVEHFHEDGKDFMFVLCDLENDKVCLKLFQINENIETINDSAIELTSTILENFPLENAKFCYQFGKFYKLTDDKILVYSLPQFQFQYSITLPMITDLKEGERVVSFKPISPNRILLTVNNKIYLLDLIHNSILSERELTHLKTFQLLKTAVVDTNINQNRTLAIGVSTKFGSNPTSSLELLNVDVGTSTIKDSLGKSFQTSSTENNVQSLKSLFDDENDYSDKEKQVKNFNYEKIYKELVDSKNDVTKFDDIFFKSFDIKKEYYTEKDRFIYNHEFLVQIIDLIFETFKEEYPKTFTYLLTDPLFPLERTKGLLARLNNHPRLFKQAIVTCPNLPLNELLAELFTISNGELSLDISLRILQDYTRDSIKKELKKLPKIEVENFIEFIIDEESDIKDTTNAPHLFQLLSLVVDSIGLFALDNAVLERLSKYIDEQVAIAQSNTELWHLLDYSNVLAYKNDKFVTSTSKDSNTSLKLQEEVLPKYSVEYLDL